MGDTEAPHSSLDKVAASVLTSDAVVSDGSTIALLLKSWLQLFRRRAVFADSANHSFAQLPVLACCGGRVYLGLRAKYAQYKLEHVYRAALELHGGAVDWHIFTEPNTWWNVEALPSYLAELAKHQEGQTNSRRIVAGGGSQLMHEGGRRFLVVRPSSIILSRESVELLSASTTDSGWSYLEWCRHEYVRSHPSRDPIIAMSWGVSSGALYNAEHLLSWCLSAQPWSKLYGLKKTYPTFPAAWEVTHRPTWLIDLHWRDARCEGRRLTTARFVDASRPQHFSELRSDGNGSSAAADPCSSTLNERLMYYNLPSRALRAVARAGARLRAQRPQSQCPRGQAELRPQVQQAFHVHSSAQLSCHLFCYPGTGSSSAGGLLTYDVDLVFRNKLQQTTIARLDVELQAPNRMKLERLGGLESSVPPFHSDLDFELTQSLACE